MTQGLMRVKEYLFIPWNSQMEVTLPLRQSSALLDWLTSISVEVKQLQSTVELDLAAQEL